MELNEHLKLENQLCFNIYATSRRITKLYKPHLEKIGLTYPQYITMLVLWEKESISSKELGNLLYLDSGTLTPLLKRLEKIGLLVRKRDVSDERNLVITITNKGNELKDKAKCIPEKLLLDIDMPIDEVINLREKLKKLLGKL
ncbi:MAG: MarR family transcriptional regulator [Clostridiales bacterium]